MRISDRPLGALPMTNVGHWSSEQIVVHDSYMYIGQGVGRQLHGAGDRRCRRLERVPRVELAGGTARLMMLKKINFSGSIAPQSSRRRPRSAC